MLTAFCGSAAHKWWFSIGNTVASLDDNHHLKVWIHYYSLPVNSDPKTFHRHKTL